MVETSKVRGRSGWLSGLFGGTGLVVLALSLLMLYVGRILLSSDNFAKRVSDSLDDPRVGEFVALRITDAVIAQQRDLTALRPILVVVTRGGAGAVAFLGDKTIEVPGRDIKVVDTVGAGDTFSAALLTGLRAAELLSLKRIGGLTAEKLGSVLNYAIVASSITCSRRGADLPTSADVAAVMAGNKIH